MQVRRLGWAGVEVECDGEMLVIDYVQDKAALTPFLRSPDEASPNRPVRVALRARFSRIFTPTTPIPTRSRLRCGLMHRSSGRNRLRATQTTWC